MAKTGVGIIGCGSRLKDIMWNVLRSAPDIEIRSLCDPAAQSVEMMRQLLPNDVKVVDDYRQLLEDPSIEWVMVGSWNCFHREHAIAALDAGKNVFCEKPLATTFEDALAIRDTHRRSGKQFVMGFNLRYTPHYRRVRQLVSEGAIGEIISQEFNETLEFNHGGFIHQDWRRHTRHAGTHLLEKCCHDIDVAAWWTASLPVRVASFGGRRFFLPENAHHADRIGPDPHSGRPAYQGWPRTGSNPFLADKDIVDHQVAIIEYANGVRATFHTNCNAAINERRCYILGSEGAIRADLITGRVELKRIGWNEPTTVFPTVAGGHGGGDEVMARELGEIMCRGMTPPTTVEDGLISAATCFAIDQAMESGEVVDVRPYWQKAGLSPSPAVGAGCGSTQTDTPWIHQPSADQ